MIRRRRARRGTRWRIEPSPPHADLDPDDAADIDAQLAAVTAEEAQVLGRLLVTRLRPLVDRRVPVRGVEPGLGSRAARIRFADGTRLLVRGGVPGDVGVLILWMREGSVPPVALTTHPDGTRLVLRSPDRRRTMTLVVTGLDQPD